MWMKLCHLFRIIKKMTDFPDAPITTRRIPYQSRSTNLNSVTIGYAHGCVKKQIFPLHLEGRFYASFAFILNRKILRHGLRSILNRKFLRNDR